MKWIAVDPDGEFLTRSAMILVSPRDVSYLKQMALSDKSESYSQEQLERYQYHDIMIDDECRKAIVSPKLEAVTGAVNYMMENCTPPRDTYEIMTVTKLFKVGGAIVDEYSQKYMDWVAQQVRELATNVSD